MFEFDELRIYRGKDIKITPKITVIQPTLDEIERFGEKRYFNAVYNLTAVGADLKWQLWDFEGIDYTKIEDYDLFIKFTSKLVSSKKDLYKELVNNETSSNYWCEQFCRYQCGEMAASCKWRISSGHC